MENKDLSGINTNEITKEAWDAYQEDYANLHVQEYDLYINGHAGIDCYEPLISLIGDVKGLKLLDTCCSSDAWQAYSWHTNLSKQKIIWVENPYNFLVHDNNLFTYDKLTRNISERKERRLFQNI